LDPLSRARAANQYRVSGFHTAHLGELDLHRVDGHELRRGRDRVIADDAIALALDADERSAIPSGRDQRRAIHARTAAPKNDVRIADYERAVDFVASFFEQDRADGVFIGMKARGVIDG